VPDRQLMIDRISAVCSATPAGAQRPDISSGEALKRALLASKSIALSPGPSGVYLSSLFEKWGVADELKPKVKQAGGLIGDVVARGEAEIGFQQVSELLSIKGITYLGPLSDDIQLITVFSGAVHNQAKNPAGAKLAPEVPDLAGCSAGNQEKRHGAGLSTKTLIEYRAVALEPVH
jgi:molybdate transport system substrate-binding protein